MAITKTAKQKSLQRLGVLIGTLLIQMGYGLIFTWQIFAPQLCNSAGKPILSTGQVCWIFSLALMMGAAGAIISGGVMDRVGSRRLVVFSALLSGLGYLMGSLFGNAFPTQLFFTALLCGGGIGLGFLVPMGIGFRWFPENKGGFAGVAIAGFLLGALIWIQSADAWFGLLNTLNLFGLDGVRSVFCLFGIISSLLILAGSIWMVEPHAAQLFGSASEASGVGAAGLSFSDFIRSPHYAMIGIGFLLSSLSGLIVVHAIAPFGFSSLHAAGFESQLAFAVSTWATAALFLMAIVGSLLWGMSSDNIGPHWSILAMTLLQGVTLLMLYKMGGNAKLLIFGASVIGAGVGGNLVLFPVMVSEVFGGRRFALYFGLVMPAYAVASGISGLMMSCSQPGNAAIGAHATPSAWLWPFVIGGISSLVATAILFWSGPKSRRKTGGRTTVL